METRYVVYLIFTNFSMLLLVGANQLENPHASIHNDIAFLGLGLAVQALCFGTIWMSQLPVFQKIKKQ